MKIRRTLFVTGLVAAIVGLVPAQAALSAPLPDDSVVPAPTPADVVEIAAAEPGTFSGDAFDPSDSVVDGGLKLMRAFTGDLSWSVDGLGIEGGSTGALQVEKPAGGTVLYAYWVVATTSYELGAPLEVSDLADMRLNGQAAVFSDDATTNGFRNFFADVTSIVKPAVDAAAPGIVTVTVDEGANAIPIEGSALVVVFDDPAVSVSSIAIYFGTSDTEGDEFTLQFDALTQPQTEDLQLSIGSAFSYGSAQTSTVTVNGELLSEVAGHFDDCDEFVSGVEDDEEWTCNNGSLLTVGGVGDSLDNPEIGTPWTTTSDDELYSISPFVEVGDTEFDVVTRNESGDDNLFLAVFFLDKVELIGATPIEAPELAETGSADTSAVFLGGMLALGLGMLALLRVRRRSDAAI